jgi:hemolysin III
MKSRAQSAGEEIANSLTHGLGVVLTLVIGPFLVIVAVRTRDPWRVVAAATYATTLLFLFTSSMLYHAVRTPDVKALFRRIDHSAIYLLIAGTYTPFTLITLRGPWGWTLFSVIWGLAIVGIALKSAFGARLPALSTAVYLGMGWLAVIALRPLMLHLAPRGLAWMVAGGLCYTLGVVFYVRDDRRRYHHAVWHLFVLAGSMAHVCAVLWYALPVSSRIID